MFKLGMSFSLEHFLIAFAVSTQFASAPLMYVRYNTLPAKLLYIYMYIFIYIYIYIYIYTYTYNDLLYFCIRHSALLNNNHQLVPRLDDD